MRNSYGPLSICHNPWGIVIQAIPAGRFDFILTLVWLPGHAQIGWVGTWQGYSKSNGKKNYRGISFLAVLHRTLGNSPMMFFRHHFPLPPTPISSLAALLWDSMRPVMHLHLPTLHLILFTNSVVDNLLWQCNHLTRWGCIAA